MDAHFFWRRLHSLTGMIPAGLFLVYHLYLQLFLHYGAEVYNDRVNRFYESPLAIGVLILLVYLPLIFHAALGIKLCFGTKIQPQYAYFPHLLYWLQRISGVGVFFFILGHVWNAKLVPFFKGTWGLHYEHLWEGFHADSSSITKTVYLLGILGACFHFSNGINTFCMTWGIALTPRAQQRVRGISIGIFLILTLSAYYALVAIW